MILWTERIDTHPASRTTLGHYYVLVYIDLSSEMTVVALACVKLALFQYRRHSFEECVSVMSASRVLQVDRESQMLTPVALMEELLKV